MVKRTKSFVVGVLVTAAALAGAAHFGLVKIDITITDKGAALIEDGQQLVQEAQTEAVNLYNEATQGEDSQ